MKVTPLDIRRKEFKRSVRGYADEEVDLFLDEVADELERLAGENTELLERLRRQDEQLSGNQQLREALEKTLVSAQFQADDTRAKARTEAEEIVREAEFKAHQVVSDSYAEVQRIQQALVQIKQLEEDFRLKFRSLLEGHLKVLAEAPINMTAVEPIIVPAPAPMAATAAATVTAPVTAATPAAPAPAMAVPVSVVEPVIGTPFVLPDAFEQVPEYPPVAASPRVEAPAVPESVVANVVAQPVAPIAADPGYEETATVEDSSMLPTALEDITATMSDSPTIISDDSVTFLGEDPLQGFFFPAKDDATADGGKSATSKPRDFEW